VRHAWPPDWRRPQNGKLVVIQPWEFGSLPEQWLKDSASVDEFWVPSEYVRRVYVESGVPADKVKVVPNGVDLEKFQPQARPMKLATQKKFKFLFVGGTIFRKGPDLLLKAYLENFTAADDVCLVIKDFGGKTVYAGQTLNRKSAPRRRNPPRRKFFISTRNCRRMPCPVFTPRATAWCCLIAAKDLVCPRWRPWRAVCRSSSPPAARPTILSATNSPGAFPPNAGFSDTKSAA
jgi:hypothetical protein